MASQNPDQVSTTWKSHVDDKLANLSAQSEAQAQTLSAISTKLDDWMKTQGKTNWPLILTAIGALGGVVWGIFYALSGSQEIARLQSQIVLMERVQPVLLSAENSKTDRDALNHRVDSNSDLIGALTGKVDSSEAALKERLREVETQFDKAGVIMNMKSAETQRMLGLLWKKVYGEDIPDIEYFPQFHRYDR